MENIKNVTNEEILEDKNKLKYKFMTSEELIISIDRLTRFKNPEIKYFRVFKDIISNHLTFPILKKNDIEKLNLEKLTKIVEQIVNTSLEYLGLTIENDYVLNQKIYDYENKIFKISDETNILIKNKINYKAVIELLNYDLPSNLKWLISLNENNEKLNREKYNLYYPVEKLIIVEGITEEILLPKFAKIMHCDFSKKGYYLISAGGKNQVVKYFYQFAEILKIPIFVLLDNDAKDNYNEILPKMRAYDKVHIINSGEFEDLFTSTLLEKALNEEFKNISVLNDDILNKNNCSTVKKLEEIFKTRGLHEFKKSEFAQKINQLPLTKGDLSDELKNIINEIILNISIKNPSM